MPNRVSYYECNYCQSRYLKHELAQECEDNCAKVSKCTICGNKCLPGAWKRRRDAAGHDHYICPTCMHDLTAIGG